MVGSGAIDRNKEAVGMMALHEALRRVCINSDWTYSVFWTIRPRPRVRGGNGCKVGDDIGSLMLMWEDGFCRGKMADCLEDMDLGEDLVRKAFSKMSIQLYNYGEGWVLGRCFKKKKLDYESLIKIKRMIKRVSKQDFLIRVFSDHGLILLSCRLMGKVASDKCHKWVFKEPSECEQSISNYWQSSFDALPTEWNEQFDSGIQTIAVIQAGHGLLQLGSCKIVPEDLHFVLRMRHTFESLGYQSGFYLSQLFASTSSPNSTGIPLKQPTAVPIHPPAAFNWAEAAPKPMQSPNFQNPTRLGFVPKDETHMFLLPHSSEPQMGNMMGSDHRVENDIKWPNGLSFFNALTGRSDDAKLLFDAEGLDGRPDGGSHQNLNQDKRNPEAGMYTDVMENFLE